jgi:hydroxyethylthiazole kinase
MKAYPFLECVRATNPLVHHITNWVTISDCAQVVKSLGASPVMAHAPEEVEEMCGMASALVLNIGTLTTEIIQSMKLAAKVANEHKIPVVLDVCGAGATSFRDRMSFELLNTVHIDVLKGNSSEMARIAGRQVRTKGVDVGDVCEDLLDIAHEIASQRDCTAVITGKRDVVADREKCFTVDNGAEIMTKVVGTGCMATSVIGAFVAASPRDLATAATAGLCCYGIAAEIAAASAKAPMLFKHALMDSIHSLTEEQVTGMQKVSQ